MPLNPSRVMRWIRRAGCMAGVVCLAASVQPDGPGGGGCYRAGQTHVVKKIVALSPWEQAERGRDALESMTEGDRTQADYARRWTCIGRSITRTRRMCMRPRR